ncbi:bacillithiol biosynthesis cysteine-adding enzyme BshC [Flammeovirgaceae bacterium SG7u.111]|nr:bacillithiol biosynthesis cysteine-adding enzyme BshC [Flammeovirgaceae bacterium SG7u.132]WPO33778.1 bacillithiol biosynthesis cysteine-adding enzyme BshC [Flammeovirgaceae bacterium SG7u.111]
MKITKLPFEKANTFSKTFLDYINQDAAVKPFYGNSPDLEGFKKQLEEKKFSTNKRQVLHQALTAQYANLSGPSVQIDALLKENTFTVTTGHQLNIFTGPLYFIYKIVTVINLAEELKKQFPEFNFVPVYWMATEDHDFEEISYFNLFGKKLVWENADAAGAVGRLSPSSLSALIEEIGEVPELFKKAYLGNDTLADATREIVSGLFGEKGLVVIDADDPQLKKEFREVIFDDLKNHNAKQTVENTSAKLDELGYKTQVFPREINFFYLEDGVRERIEKTEKGYEVLNTDRCFSEEEINQLIEQSPEKFSPNVVLRPVYQEVILPNLSYTGGPSELVYWLQLKGVFDHYQIPFPLLVPRNFALVINKANSKKVNKLALSTEELFLDEHQLKTDYLLRNSEENLELGTEIADMEKVFEAILAKAVNVDKSLEGYIKGESTKVGKQIDNIQRRLKKAEEKNQEIAINQLTGLKEKLFPGGGPQERYDNLLAFYLNNPNFLSELLETFEPLNYQYHVLEYDV